MKIFDAVVLIQHLPSGLETFGEDSDYILVQITMHKARAICLVSDKYDPISIKYLERTDRAAESQVRYTARRRDQPVPVQFRKYLHNSSNKLELIDFLVDEWFTCFSTVNVITDRIVRHCLR